MHVLIIPSEHFATSRYPLGGIFQLHQAKALHRFGFKVGIIAPGVITPRFFLKRYSYLPFEESEGFPVFRHYKRRYFPQRFADPNKAIALYKTIGLALYDIYKMNIGKPDVIHAHNMIYAGFVAQAIHEVDCVPYVITEHSSIYSNRTFEKSFVESIVACARNASALTFVSTALERRFRTTIGLTGLGTGILPNILDPSFERSVHLAQHSKQSRFTFLNIASLDENKDHRTLIEAFAHEFRGKHPVLRIGGEGHLRQKLEALTKRLGVERQVTFLGLLDRSAVMREMENSDCFVLSSQFETFGVVLIEALACGTPLVATRCGGPEDIVNENNGLLVEPGNAAEMGRAMRKIFQERERFPPDKLRQGVYEKYGEMAFVNCARAYYQQAIR